MTPSSMMPLAPILMGFLDNKLENGVILAARLESALNMQIDEHDHPPDVSRSLFISRLKDAILFRDFII